MASASHARRTRGARPITSACGRSAPDSSRVTVSSWRTIRDSRSVCSLMIDRRRSSRSSPSCSAKARMLVSGVWRLWLTPRRKSSLAASSSSSWVFWAATRWKSWALRIATPISAANSSSRFWSAGSQARVAGRWPTIRPRRSSPARSSARIGRGSPGTDSSSAIAAGSTSRITASIIPKASRASSDARPTRNSTPSRGEACSIAARIRPSSRLRRSSAPASRLWLSARRDSSSSPPTVIGVDRSPAETRSTAAAIARNGAVRSAASR